MNSFFIEDGDRIHSPNHCVLNTNRAMDNVQTHITLKHHSHEILYMILWMFSASAWDKEHNSQPSKSKRTNAGGCNTDLEPSVFSKCTWQLLTYLRCSAARVVWMFAIRCFVFLICSVKRIFFPFQAECRFKQQHSTTCNMPSGDLQLCEART